jgi:hypothetical protein
MSVAVRTPSTQFFQSEMSRNRPFTPRLQPTRLASNSGDVNMSSGNVMTPRSSTNSTFGKKMTWSSSTSQLGQGQTGWSKEAKKRKEMKMRVVTQPVGQGQSYQRPASRQLTIGRGARQWKQRLPSNATELLANLYETLIMAKNCEAS